MWLQLSGSARLPSGYDDKPGFLFSLKGKKLLYDTLAQVVKDKDCTVVDQVTAMQIASIEASRLRAPEGLHDDEADAFLLAVWACADGDIDVQPGEAVEAADPLDGYDGTGFWGKQPWTQMRAGSMDYEIWVTHSGSPCAICASFAGCTWPVWVGPQPAVDTYEFCRCTREPTESTVYSQWGERRERSGSCRCGHG